MDFNSFLLVLGVLLIAAGLGIWHIAAALIWLGIACLVYSLLVEYVKAKAGARAVAVTQPKRAARPSDTNAK